jgi:hypothetical protein
LCPEPVEGRFDRLSAHLLVPKHSCERRRRRRILDVRAADLQEEMAEQRFSVPSAATKTAATSEHRRERSEQSIERDARAA